MFSVQSSTTKCLSVSEVVVGCVAHSALVLRWIGGAQCGTGRHQSSQGTGGTSHLPSHGPLLPPRGWNIILSGGDTVGWFTTCLGQTALSLHRGESWGVRGGVGEGEMWRVHLTFHNVVS